MTIRRSVMMGLSVFGVLSAFAEIYQFPAGGGDLADLAKWREAYPDLASLPGSADTIKFGSSSTFTMSADMTVASFTFNFQNAILDFASSGNHTLKVLNNNSAFCAHNGTIKGGVIDRNNQTMQWFQNSGYETTLTDGCVVTNVGYFYVDVWSHSNGKLHLTGGSRIHSNSLDINSGLVGQACGNTLLEVAEGSKIFTSGDWNYSDMNSKEAESGGNVFDIHGSGSEVKLAGNFINGYHCDGNALKVTDGAEFSAKSLNVGFHEGDLYSNNNLLQVDGGTVKVTGGLYCKGDNNVIAVTNGVVDFKNKTCSFDASDSTNTRIDIINSSWKCAQFKVGNGADIHISGTQFETTDRFFGLNGDRRRDIKVCLDDELEWLPSIGYGYYFMENSTNCELTVQNSASFSAWHPTNDDYEQIIFCASAATSFGSGNVIRALSGGTISGKSVQLSGRDNTLIISNGVVSGSSAVQLGNAAWASNNTVIVQGNAPRISTAGRFYLWNYTNLRMEIPAEGYLDAWVPISAQEFYLHQDTCTFELDVSRFQPEEAKELTLMSFNTDLTAAQKTFFLAAELPPRYSLEIRNSRELVLKAKGAPKPLMLLLR